MHLLPVNRKENLKDLSLYPDISDPAWALYQSFFTTWGTAVLTGATVGGSYIFRFSMTTDGGQSSESIKASLEGSMEGISVSGSFDKSSSDKRNSQNIKSEVKVLGGDPAIAVTLGELLTDKMKGTNSDKIDQLQRDWSNSIQDQPGIYNGKFMPWHKLSLSGLLGITSKQQAALQANLAAGAKLYLKGQWQNDCPIYKWDTFKKDCVTSLKNATDANTNVDIHIYNADGNCIGKLGGKESVTRLFIQITSHTFL